MGRDFLTQARLYMGDDHEFLRPRQDNDYASTASWVWHYTHPAAVDSIFSSRRLWAAHAGELNDSGEITYGRNVLLEVFDRMDNEGYYARDDTPESQHQAFAALGTALRNQQENVKAVDYFILCGSADFDVLNQWQHYGASGYAIGLPADAPLAVAVERRTENSAHVTGGTVPLELWWRRVLYDRNEQLYYAASQIMTFIEGNNLSVEALDGSNDGSTASVVEDFFAPTVGLMKHWRFAAERECRIIFAARTADYLVADGFIKVLGEQFRQFQCVGGVSGDTANQAHVSDLPLSELRLGPVVEGVRDRRLESAARMLRLRGYKVINREPGTSNELFDSADARAAAASDTIGLSYSEIPYATNR